MSLNISFCFIYLFNSFTRVLFAVISGNRLFLVCRQPEPTFSSDMFIKTTVVNFSATFKGLQDQLLSLVINLVRKKGSESARLLHI